MITTILLAIGIILALRFATNRWPKFAYVPAAWLAFAAYSEAVVAHRPVLATLYLLGAAGCAFDARYPPRQKQEAQ